MNKKQLLDALGAERARLHAEIDESIDRQEKALDTMADAVGEGDEE